MIKIIAGKFGLQSKNGVIIKDSTSEPFETSEETEARLVKNGIAKYVNGSVKSNTKVKDGDETPPAVDPNQLPKYDETMKLVDLKEIASKYGVDASKCTSKKAVVELIDAKAEETEDEEEDGDETPPELSNVDVVI